ncbi:MBL fold metallo-hydrolase [Paenibacillus sp. GCM10027628]|uniref:MBL fold metallo-hydrolase n=1 Tax=Paenibacillus sp. GCM10027628 TaxID=3273413 RepID=UPI00363370EE
MKIANGVEMLELRMGSMIIHPVVIRDEHEVILVDTGSPGQLPAIKKAMEKAGISFHKLSKVILTHQDLDHTGSLPQILDAIDHPIEVFAHEMEKPHIEGDKPLLKMAPDRWLNVKVDKTIDDGEVLPYCGGITVIFTPGHTPGHISLYLNESKTLITGDALTGTNEMLQGPMAPPLFALDIDMALKSLRKFAKYDIETVICYHGGIFRDKVSEQLRELAQQGEKSVNNK